MWVWSTSIGAWLPLNRIFAYPAWFLNCGGHRCSDNRGSTVPLGERRQLSISSDNNSPHTAPTLYTSYHPLSLVPRPINTGPDIHCMRMCQFFMEFRETVIFCTFSGSQVSLLVGGASSLQYSQLHALCSLQVALKLSLSDEGWRHCVSIHQGTSRLASYPGQSTNAALQGRDKVVSLAFIGSYRMCMLWVNLLKIYNYLHNEVNR